MSDSTPGKITVLNWRGPMLAAGIFAASFALLSLMARQNESKTSDMGSSLREDPYGASLLFDSYARAGYQVRRSQDEDSLHELEASGTTAFFIAGHSLGDWMANPGRVRSGAKIRVRLEEFLARGGRVVLVEPRWELKSDAQGWQVSDAWDRKDHDDTPSLARPDFRAMPAASETMYLAADAPWLQTDAQWTALYTADEGANSEGGTPAHVYMAMRRVGNGELIVASQEFFLLNETVKTHPNPVLLDFLAGGRRVIWVDETLHGLHQDEGVLWLVQRYRLQTALLLFWATLLVLLWSMSGDLVRRPARNPAAQIIRYGEGPGVAAQRLLQRSTAKEHIVAECWEQFRRCWPQDAHAISADPAWAARLHAALAQPPSLGYNELTLLIAERRASAKGLARIGHHASSKPAVK